MPADYKTDRSGATFAEDGIGLAESGVTEADRVHLQDLIPTTARRSRSTSRTSLKCTITFKHHEHNLTATDINQCYFPSCVDDKRTGGKNIVKYVFSSVKQEGETLPFALGWQTHILPLTCSTVQ